VGGPYRRADRTIAERNAAGRRCLHQRPGSSCTADDAPRCLWLHPKRNSAAPLGMIIKDKSQDSLLID
jgi:hypothetical protein